MLSERSLLLTCGGGFNSIEKQLCGAGTNLVVAPSSTAAAAAAFFYLEKVKNDKLSPQITTVTVPPVSPDKQTESLKDATMESAMIKSNNNNDNTNKNSDNNNGNNKITNSLIINHVRNALSSSTTSPNMSGMSNSQQRQQYQQQSLLTTSQQTQSSQKQPHQNILSSTGNVKKERLSPGTNGDLQSTISRSRSNTPSSFRGTSPQQIPPDPLMPLSSFLRIQHATSADHQNLPAIATNMDTASLVSSTAALPTDYSTRNYSDIMRSLAAKYNDTNPINQPSTRRNPFFDTPLSTQNTPVSTKNINQQTVNRSTTATAPSTPLSKKDAPSHILPRLSMSPNEVAVAAAAASFLSSLPFSQSVCPPLIDMSSTQALVTLARAAKEAEIHTILRSSQQNPKPLNTSPIPPYPSLTIALQQAAQFVSPAIVYSSQLQQQQQQPTPTSNQSSPLHTEKTVSNDANDPANKSKSVVPLDLSSQPPSAKRFKIESYATGSSELSDDLKISLKRSNPTDVDSFKMSENNEIVASSDSIQKVIGSRSSSPEKLSNIHLNDTPAQAGIHQSKFVAGQCQAQCEEVAQWSVDDVCAFVGEIDICADYVQRFRDQCIDGSGLPLLTEDHLLTSLGMKLGPALKLRSMLAKKLGGPCPCVACISQTRQILAFQAAAKSAVVRHPATISMEPPIVQEGPSSREEHFNTVKITNINDKLKPNHEEKRDNEQKQQVIETQELSLNSNNDNNSNCAALTLQICANIYKNDTNDNSHNTVKSCNNHRKNISKVSNTICNNITDCACETHFNSKTNEDCKNNNSADNSKSANNGSILRTGSGDIADVGS